MAEQLTNRRIADTFQAIADSMEILGEDRFRLLAYRRAAGALADLPQPLAMYRERDELDAIPGVGKAIADKIEELLDTGQLQFYEKLRARLPESVLGMLRIPNLGPRTVGRLYTDLGIDSVEALRAAAESGKLDGIKGFGAKTIAGILQGISSMQQEQRILLFDALRAAESLITALRQALPEMQHISYAGSLRRGRDLIGDIDLLAASEDPSAVITALKGLPIVAQLVSSGTEKATVMLHNGLQIDMIALPPNMWGSALQHFTGSRQHNIRMREIALDRGLSFSEHGFKRQDGTLITCATEEEVYAQIGLPWIAPELREQHGEFEAATAGKLPTLITLEQMRCDLHMHSTWSDGKSTLRAMAEAARARGYSHMAITDHSALLGITTGLDGARLYAQAAEVAALNQELAPCMILRGVEVDITADGSLALPDDVLADLDIVVASPHLSLQQSLEASTERILRAIRNPHVDIIGHPTGRLLNSRAGSPIDIDAIGRAAAETGTLLEVNSGPERLDLEAGAVRHVLELGACITINSDSHHSDNLGWIRLGVTTARRGWAETDRVANSWDLKTLQDWLARTHAQGA